MSKRGRGKTQTDLERLEERASSDELAAGAQIGRYVIRRRLGEGGMGVVYGAHDSKLAREVALKVVRPRGDVRAMQSRLEREGQAMARLSHPHVVPVFDTGMQDGQLFLAMELVEGETLRGWVTRLRPWRDVVRVFAKAGRGLAAAHASGVLHRDFKPDNVLIDRTGEPRITDFGLARELAVADAAGTEAEDMESRGDGALVQVTATGALAGTPAYMAPEQLRGEPGDARADQFGCCVALFEVLHGARPFVVESSTPESRIAEIRAGRISKLATNRRLPGWLHQAIARGLAFEPAQRWPSMLALVDALERGLRQRRRRIYGLVAGLAIAGTAVGMVVATRFTAPPGCLEVAARGDDAPTIVICKDEYARGNDPRVGAKLADALRRRHKLDDAATLANELLATSARADALYTLGKIAGARDRPSDAVRLLRQAGELHREQQQWGAAASDLLAAAQFSTDVVDQLTDLDQATRDAQRAGAANSVVASRSAAAFVLSQIGARVGALGEIARAAALIPDPFDQLRLGLERGNVYQNLGEHMLAIAAFELSLVHAAARGDTRRALSARLNLAYSLTEVGLLAEAAIQLKSAIVLDPDDHKLVIRLTLEARLAARGGDPDPDRAVGLVDRAFTLIDAKVPDDRLALEVERAEIALQQGELVAAEAWARRAIATIEQLRSSHPPVELRSWMVVDRRIPYEVLFASLAGRGDAAQALIVFDRYRGLGVLAALAQGDMTATESESMFPIGELARLLPQLQSSALATPAEDAGILEATRKEALLVLIVARGDLWRITADEGRVQVARIGALSTLHGTLERLRAAPGDRAAAAALGAALVPAELARTTDRVLHVVLDEPLAWLPIAALRIGGRRLIDARPIVRAARASAVTCVPRVRDPRPVVRLESRDATRTSLAGLARSSRLDLVAPMEADSLGHALVLRDGRVRALELAGAGSVPSQVVLEVADATAAGSISLAMAFVAAGSDQVIAPIGPVSRATIGRLTEHLARVDGRDLTRALADIQRGNPNDRSDHWLGFAVFGRPVCGIQP